MDSFIDGLVWTALSIVYYGQRYRWYSMDCFIDGLVWTAL